MRKVEPKAVARKLFKALSRLVLQSPERAGHTLPSLIHASDSVRPPSGQLIDIALEAIALAARTEISGYRPELSDSLLYNRYPGEHYRLLNALVLLLKPAVTVEIGTFTGMGCFALKQAAPGVIHTFDIAPWNSFESHLTQSDFAAGRLIQHLVDLAEPTQFEAHRALLDQASLIFLDGPKDGLFEGRLLEHLTRIEPLPGRILVIDDIRFVNMIDCWTSIASPKLDLTSFGHWSGTGLVDLSNPLQLA